MSSILKIYNEIGPKATKLLKDEAFNKKHEDILDTLTSKFNRFNT